MTKKIKSPPLQEIGNVVISESTKFQRALFSALEDRNEEKSEISSRCETFNCLFQPSKTSDAIVPGISPKQQQNLILETVQDFSKSQARSFFQGLLTHVRTIVADELYVPDSAYQNDDDDYGEDEDAVIQNADIIPDESSTRFLHFLKHTSSCVQVYVESQKDRSQKSRSSLSRSPSLSVVAEVYNVALELHNILFSLQSSGPEGIVTQNAIIGLCEAWWHANAAQRENLIVQCLPLLVLQTLDGKNFQKSHVKRLLQLKDAFRIIDFTNPSSDSLRSLLLRVASSPLCLRMPEGKRFLAILFQEPSLVADLHLAIRAQIPNARATVLQSYGEIYFKAWKEAANDHGEMVRETIEQEALQDLVHAGIHVASNSTAKSILTVLESIHSSKTTDVEGLLHRLYSPILWRALGAANAQVRVNAVRALGQVFPLQDASHTQTKTAVSKGTTALKTSLQDKDHRVRVAGSEATSKVCAEFWDVLPASDIRMLLNHIVMEHASDASSAAVRAAALDAVSTLLETSQSRAILRPLLPSLGNLIHDKAEKVRLAAVRMLIVVKRIPGIRFYHVVPVSHLTARLSEEGRLHRSPCNPVAKELTGLLLNSYFPQGGSGADQLKRTLTYLLTDPDAAAVFYANLPAHLTLNSVIKFIAMLLTCLNSAVKVDQTRQINLSKKQKKRRRHGSEEDHPEGQEEQTLSASNTPLMAGLAETICVLWESIVSELETPKNHSSNELLLESISEVKLSNIIIYFEQKAMENMTNDEEQLGVRDDCIRTCSAILRCVGWLPSGTVEGILAHISTKMASLSSNDDESSEFSRQQVACHIALLCQWGLTEDVASSLAASLEADSENVAGLASPLLFDEDDDARRSTDTKAGNSRSRSNRRRRASCGQSTVPTMPSRVAWRVMKDILAGSNSTDLATRREILSSSVACNTIEGALERGTIVAERILLADSGLGKSLEESEIEFILCACEMYGRFALHKEACRSSGIGFSSQAKLLLDWTTEKVVPALKAAQSGETELRKLDLSCILNTSDSLVLSPPRPRRRANLRRTPERSLGDSTVEDDLMLNEPEVFLVRAIAASLLQSSCIMFSEWLCVGGEGAPEIADSSVKWACIFETDEDVDASLLPAFARLAIHLCKSSGSFLLLKHLLMKCNEATDCNNTIQEALCSLLLVRHAQRENLLRLTVSTVLDAAYDLLLEETDAAPVECPMNVDELWYIHRGSLAPAMSTLIGNQQAMIELLRKIVSQMKSDEVYPATITDFQLKFLWLLANTVEDVSKLSSEIRQLDFEQLDNEGSRNVIAKLIEIIG